jgi:HD superfamily phosphodiesterase
MRLAPLRALLLLVVTAPAVAATAATAPAAAAPDWRENVRAFAAKHFKNPAWGYSHCLRDYALATELAASDHASIDDDVLYAASFLHDIAAFPPWEDTKIDHSDVGARVVDGVLQRAGFPMAKIDAVRGAIRTHMYYRDPQGPEALYLHDADALDWLGAIGAARIFGLADPKALGMLQENLQKVPSRVLSPAGKAMLPQRQAELEKFLSDLSRETQQFKTL